jgi:UDP-GlcNAc3NAcA epimerase
MSVWNLKNEGIVKNVNLVGDVMYDSFMYCSELEKDKKPVCGDDSYCLLTLHRQENTDKFDVLNMLFKSLNNISKIYDCRIVFPVHPRVNLILKTNKFKFNEFENILFIEPVSYINMINLELNAKIILTDSGGVQKEAYFAKTPCITLREQTEWEELVTTKMNVLTGLDLNKISKAFNDFMNMNYNNFNCDLYGDGKTGQKILSVIKTIKKRDV